MVASTSTFDADAGVVPVNRLTKRFGAVTAVDDLSFTVTPRRVTGFLGPNGAEQDHDPAHDPRPRHSGCRHCDDQQGSGVNSPGPRTMSRRRGTASTDAQHAIRACTPGGGGSRTATATGCQSPGRADEAADRRVGGFPRDALSGWRQPRPCSATHRSCCSTNRQTASIEGSQMATAVPTGYPGRSGALPFSSPHMCCPGCNRLSTTSSSSRRGRLIRGPSLADLEAGATRGEVDLAGRRRGSSVWCRNPVGWLNSGAGIARHQRPARLGPWGRRRYASRARELHELRAAGTEPGGPTSSLLTSEADIVSSPRTRPRSRETTTTRAWWINAMVVFRCPCSCWRPLYRLAAVVRTEHRREGRLPQDCMRRHLGPGDRPASSDTTPSYSFRCSGARATSSNPAVLGLRSS